LSIAILNLFFPTIAPQDQFNREGKRNKKKSGITGEDNPRRPHKEHVELLATAVLIDLIADCDFTSQEHDLRGRTAMEDKFLTSSYCTQCLPVMLASDTF
jgi:hypothetical protein